MVMSAGDGRRRLMCDGDSVESVAELLSEEEPGEGDCARDTGDSCGVTTSAMASVLPPR